MSEIIPVFFEKGLKKQQNIRADMKLKEALQNMLFPHGIKCIVCNDELNFYSDSGLCEDCLASCLLSENVSFCKRCGRFLKATASYCLECQTKLPPIASARAPFIFEGDVKHLIHALKFGNARYLVTYLAKFMAKTYNESEMIADFVTFVPMSVRKMRLRGYNQAELLAHEVAKLLNLPCVNVLDKVKDVKNTAKMKRSKRKEILQNSVSVISGIDFGQRRALLIDDVYTTGTTISECAIKLKSCGISEVSALTFATSKIIQK